MGMTEQIQESKVYRVLWSVLWIVLPLGLMISGALVHSPLLVILGLITLVGFALEIGTWSERTRRLAGTPIAAVGGVISLVYGFETRTWLLLTLGVCSSLSAAINVMILRQERRRGQPGD